MCLFTASKDIKIGQPSQEKRGMSKYQWTVNHPVVENLLSSMQEVMTNYSKWDRGLPGLPVFMPWLCCVFSLLLPASEAVSHMVPVISSAYSTNLLLPNTRAIQGASFFLDILCHTQTIRQAEKGGRPQKFNLCQSCFRLVLHCWKNAAESWRACFYGMELRAERKMNLYWQSEFSSFPSLFVHLMKNSLFFQHVIP